MHPSCKSADGAERTARTVWKRAWLTTPQLAIATLATTFSTAAFFLSGGEKVDKSQPPINAKSKDEESFVK
jgi:F-type H+-transporting ATPase subunit k